MKFLKKSIGLKVGVISSLILIYYLFPSLYYQLFQAKNPLLLLPLRNQP